MSRGLSWEGFAAPVADEVVNFLINDSSYITGQNFFVNGGSYLG